MTHSFSNERVASFPVIDSALGPRVRRALASASEPAPGALHAQAGAKPLPGLYSLAWPLLGHLLLTHFVGFADVYIMSRVSDGAAACFGAVSTITTLAMLMFSFLGQGGSMVHAQCLGAGEAQRSAQYHATGALLHAIVGAAASLGLFCFAAQVGRLLGLSGHELVEGARYLRVVSVAMLLYSVTAQVSGVLSAHGHTRRAFAVSLVASLVNVAGLYFAVACPFGPRWGIAGAALSTVVAALIAAAYAWWGALRLGIVPRLSRSPRVLIEQAEVILRCALPTALEPMLWQAAQVATTIIIMGIGLDDLAARVYALQVTNVLGTFSTALAQGSQIAIGHLMGARALDRLDAFYRRGLRVSISIAVLLASLVAVFSEAIMRQFSSNAGIVATGCMLLSFAPLYLPTSALTTATAMALRAVGHASYPALVGVVVVWGLFCPLAYALCVEAQLGIAGVFIAMVVDENLRAVLLWRRWRRVVSPDRRHLLSSYSPA